MASLSRSVCTAKQVPRPENWHVELTSCLRRSVAGHQRLLQFCCALLRALPEPPCEVHPRLFPLHCTSTLLKWDTCTGCAQPHYPSGIHVQAVHIHTTQVGYMYRLCTSILLKWDTCTGCAQSHYPSGIHVQAVHVHTTQVGYMYRMCP